MNRKILWLAVLSLGLLTGCGAARPSRYYQLSVPGNTAPVPGSTPYAVSLLLGPLRASHLYREDRVVYSSTSEHMGTYEYQRWAEPPTEMLEEILLRELRASGRYRAVDVLRSNARGDFALYGHLYDFKEVSGAPLLARVTMDLELRNIKTGSTVWTHSYTYDEPVAGKDMAAVIAALNRNAHRGVADVLSSLDQYFSTHPVS